MEKKSYAGRIGHSGAMHVKALFASDKKQKTKKKTGTDLRSGK